MSGRSFDIIVEVSEGFLNRSLRHLFESSAIPSVYEGEHSTPAPQLLKAYSELKYKIRLSEPLHVDAVKDEMINISFGADVSLFFTLFMIEANVRGIVESKPAYDRGKTQLELNIKGIKLTSIGFRGAVELPDNLVRRLNDVVNDVIKEGLGSIDAIPVSPILGNLSLPMMPPGNEYLLPLGFGNVAVGGDDMVSLGFDISTPGSGAKVIQRRQVLAGDLAVLVSESAVNKTIDFWWKHTVDTKTQPIKGRIEIGDIEELVDYLSNFSVELLPKIFTLGFIEIDWDLIDVWLDYEGTIDYSKPNLSLERDTISLNEEAAVDITAFLRVELDVSLEFDTSGAIPDILTPWKDDHVVGRDRRVFEVMRYRVNRKRIKLDDADLSLTVDEEQRIVWRMEHFDLELGLNWRLPRRLVNRFERNIERQVLASYPSIPISPSVVRHQLEGTDLLMELDIKKIIHREKSIIVQADVEYR